MNETDQSIVWLPQLAQVDQFYLQTPCLLLQTRDQPMLSDWSWYGQGRTGKIIYNYYI